MLSHVCDETSHAHKGSPPQSHTRTGRPSQLTHARTGSRCQRTRRTASQPRPASATRCVQPCCSRLYKAGRAHGNRTSSSAGASVTTCAWNQRPLPATISIIGLPSTASAWNGRQPSSSSSCGAARRSPAAPLRARRRAVGARRGARRPRPRRLPAARCGSLNVMLAPLGRLQTGSTRACAAKRGPHGPGATAPIS